jgi:hypothetical protein
MSTLRKVISRPSKPEQLIDWKATFERMRVGDKILVKGFTQATLGSRASHYNRDGKRFVTKTHPLGAYVIRVE